MKNEQILVRITGQDRPGLTASVMGILAKYDAQILDIGQADIHSTLSLGILIRMDEMKSGLAMKELLFKATELGVNIGFAPISDDEYEDWVGHQGKNRYILMVLGRQLEARQIEAATRILADQGLNIDSIVRLTGRKSIKQYSQHTRACIQFSLRGEPVNRQEMQSKLMKMSQDMEIDFSFQRDDMFRRMRRLICFDMDSTLIQTECIDELAERNGVGAEVRAITESAMRGEIDFKESFTRRVALLKGLDVSGPSDVCAQDQRLQDSHSFRRLYLLWRVPAAPLWHRLCLCQRTGNRQRRKADRPLCRRDCRRSPQGRAAETYSPGRKGKPGTDHCRRRRCQRPAHD